MKMKITFKPLLASNLTFVDLPSGVYFRHPCSKTVQVKLNETTFKALGSDGLDIEKTEPTSTTERVIRLRMDQTEFQEM